MFRSVRNFYNKDGKPRMYYVREWPDGKGWWACKAIDARGNVIGYGRARSMERHTISSSVVRHGTNARLSLGRVTGTVTDALPSDARAAGASNVP